MNETSDTRLPIRRDERVARTRQALIDAALALFSSKGYDATTAEEIAAAAGVSPRTFFRHFPTKESVLFFAGHNSAHLFATALRNRPAEVSELEAIRAALQRYVPYVTPLRDRIRLYDQAVASSIVLRGREQVVEDQYIGVVASALAARRGETSIDRLSNLLAHVCYLVLRLSLTEWLQDPTPRALDVIIGEHFDRLVTAFRH